MKARGDYIDGAFRAPEGSALVSKNPARGGERVLETAYNPARAEAAAAAAAAAAPRWRRLSMADRMASLARFRDALSRRKDAIADAIVLETGKIRGEAIAEARSLVGRFAIAAAHIERDLSPNIPAPGEILRYHPVGVVAVIGPFNYPLHLCHAHAIPALLCGNAVVVKPSEVAPLCAQVYAEAIAEAELFPGILNVVCGGAESARALLAHEAVRGVCFTGSYAVGRAIKESLLDRPEVLLALEMGGKNTAVVLDDADVRQAAHEIVCGGNLTTGQRCTATDRVIVSRKVKGPLMAALETTLAAVRFGDPDAGDSFAGPLTTRAGAAKVTTAIAAARALGAVPIIAGGVRDDGFFCDPSLHLLPDGCHHLAGYTDVELFGPDIAISVAADDDDILAALNASPYGFANTVFTANEDRFARFFADSNAGILNRNRSTNQASPSLPFGGIGKSGNFRPAGAFAQRNVTYAVATKARVLGAIEPHPALAQSLPDPDLGALMARHEAEENAELSRTLLSSPRPMTTCLPAGGVLPRSRALLDRLEAGDRVPREKKPPVIDHLRSAGPYLVSIDDDPMAVLDGMSQTATVCGGLAEDPVVRAYLEGDFGDTTVRAGDTTRKDCAEAEKLATTLRHLVPGLAHVTFTNSGAEANEKAFALCRHHAGREKSRVLAFEGSFHGRTLFALHTTFSPKKRTPFEIGDFVTFAPYPVWVTPRAGEPPAPAGFYAACAAADGEALLERFGDPDDDALLSAEVAALLCCHRAWASGDFYACIIEPMQSEGGDRYATSRFYRALRLLSRAHQVPLIFDEVQTGFGLGQSFAWHERFQLVDARGQRDFPDAVTFAKRAQVGVCMSRFEDPEPTPTSAASLIRGRIHAEMMSTAHQASRIQALVWPRLSEVAQAFPSLCHNPRAEGYAMAFDLPTPAHLAAYLGQRFWRGAVVFGAGDRTVRYRLSDAYHAREVDELFVTIRRSLAWLEAHPGKSPPAWEDFAPPAKEPKIEPQPVRIRTIPATEGLALLERILEIEREVYEPARQTAPVHIRAALEHPEGIVTVAEVEGGGRWELCGFALGVPLEDAVDEGPDRDPMRGRKNSLYSVSLTVVPEHQGRGTGRALKRAQLEVAAAMTTADGSPRYRYVTGRNRIGHTARMTHLNRVFGAHVVCVLTGQYEDPEGQALYYRIPVGPLSPEAVGDVAPPADHDCTGVQRPLAKPPASLVRAEAGGLLYGPAVNKLTLVNYATPAVIRAIEQVSALYPELPHLYLSSGPDEAMDKAIRLARYHRPGAHVAIGLEGGYVGHTTGCARSLSDPATHRQGEGTFAWPRVPHPATAGAEATVAAIDAAVTAAGGADKILAIVVESVQQRTGALVDESAWRALCEARDRHRIPLCCVDTAGAGYRSARGAFASQVLGRESGAFADLCAWWGGGQTAYLHVAGPLFVSAPLTLVSTWDGDELSLIREHHQLRCAMDLFRTGAIAAGTRALDAIAARFSAAKMPCSGLGLYRVVHAGDRADATAEALARHHVRAGRVPGGRLILAPPLDGAEAAAEAMAAALDDLS
ncbi:MAG TPA: aldehyde dehydrogenase family protein [Kofleriaceae bacterium]|nr:aldehyde dehydrogenase family protein [Kofleriaceae bacterium]